MRMFSAFLGMMDDYDARKVAPNGDLFQRQKLLTATSRMKLRSNTPITTMGQLSSSPNMTLKAKPKTATTFGLRQ